MDIIFKIEQINKDRIDMNVKGTPTEIIEMMVQTMVQAPEVVEIILRSAEAFKQLQRKSRIILPHE